MHVTSSELRTVHRGTLLLHLGLIGGVGCVLAEIPEGGTAGTILEEPCTVAHWGMVLRGSLELRRNGDRLALPAGTVFHVPDGTPAHSFQADGAAVMISFGQVLVGEHTVEAALTEPEGAGEPEASGEPATSGASTIPTLGAKVLEPLTSGFEAPEAPITIAGPAASIPIASGRITAQAAPMGEWIFCEARFGPTSGYATGWCDLPHWGLVLRGSLTIEWENDVEMLLAGDVFYCPAGPPGHRYEVADGATIIDFTPRQAMAAGMRSIAWRPSLADLERPTMRKRRRAVAC